MMEAPRTALVTGASRGIGELDPLLPAPRAAAARRPERGARVIAVSSIAGQAAEPGLAAYGATRAALTLLCEAVRAEEGARGVLATASPGPNLHRALGRQERN
jgi:NAD(P)-dependent dehydrogenase (short-subunit alcohol dehydrogenase family)